MHWVYILRCIHNERYVGETSRLDARVRRHNEGTASGFTNPTDQAEVIA